MPSGRLLAQRSTASCCTRMMTRSSLYGIAGDDDEVMQEVLLALVLD